MRFICLAFARPKVNWGTFTKPSTFGMVHSYVPTRLDHPKFAHNRRQFMSFFPVYHFFHRHPMINSPMPQSSVSKSPSTLSLLPLQILEIVCHNALKSARNKLQFVVLLSIPFVHHSLFQSTLLHNLTTVVSFLLYSLPKTPTFPSSSLFPHQVLEHICHNTTNSAHNRRQFTTERSRALSLLSISLSHVSQ